MSRPYVVRPGEGRVLDLGNFEAVVLADEPATAGAFWADDLYIGLPERTLGT